MFDTNVTIVGNVLTAPEWRRTTQSNTLVANFKVASTARRLDRETGRWVDGNSLRVRVNCWRKLAEGVAVLGDGRRPGRGGRAALHPRLDRRRGQPPHRLRAGGGRRRARPVAWAGQVRPQPARHATSAVEDAEAETRVHGEATDAVPAAEAPAGEGHAFDAEFDFAAESTAGAGSRYDAGPQPMPGGSDDELSEYPEHETSPVTTATTTAPAMSTTTSRPAPRAAATRTARPSGSTSPRGTLALRGARRPRAGGRARGQVAEDGYAGTAWPSPYTGAGLSCLDRCGRPVADGEAVAGPA